MTRQFEQYSAYNPMSTTTTAGTATVNRTTDNRKKLEADCEKLIGNIQERIFSGRDAGALRCQLKELLDRQAAITERRWMGIVGASADANIELKRQIDELQAKLDELQAKLDEQTASRFAR